MPDVPVVTVVDPTKLPVPVTMENVTLTPFIALPSLSRTVAVRSQGLLVEARRDEAEVVGSIVRETLFPVAVENVRVMTTAPAEPVTVAETASWMLKLGALLPAV